MLTLKTKNRELVELFNGLQAVANLKGVRFGLLVSKNVRILQQELDDLDKASKPTEDFMQLAQQVNALGSDSEAIEKLESENKELVEARKTQLEEVDKLLEDSAEISLHTISEDILPEDITALQITNIDKLIK
jgi:hypothetical protein